MGRRLFLAATPPPATLDALAAFAARTRRGGDGWRWAGREALHLTLRFFGDTEERLLAPLRAELTAVAARGRRGLFSIEGIGAFPSPSRPRVLWAGIAGPIERLAALAGDAEQAARRLGFAPEARPFAPHLTLARAAREGRPTMPRPAETPVFGPFPVDEMILFESHLGPGGARYEPLGRFALQGDGDGV